MNARRMSLYQLAMHPDIALPSPLRTASTQDQTERPTGLVDSGIYLNGKRVAAPTTLTDTFQDLTNHHGAMAWMDLLHPDQAELRALAERFDLSETAIEEATQAHRRPKLKRYQDTLLVVLRGALYHEGTEELGFGELRILVGPNFIITVSDDDSPDLAKVRQRFEHDAARHRFGPEAVLCTILDAIVDGYGPAVSDLEHHIDEIETEVFSGQPAVSRRINGLSREVIEFQRSTLPVTDVVNALVEGFTKYGISDALQHNLLGVTDRVIQANERITNLRFTLRDILTLNAALVAQRQNEEMRHLAHASHSQNEEIKKISAWAAILFAPTLVGNVYGMNFENMPELHWEYGYPLSVALMAAMSVSLYSIFRYRNWI